MKYDILILIEGGMNMKVELLNYTPNGEKLIASAAKLCYSPANIKEIEEGITDEEASRFVSLLANMGHESPIEHISFTFGIEGVSRSLTHQLVRHRIASYSQKSQRYVTEDSFEYIIPPAVNRQGLKNDYISIMDMIQEEYSYLLDALKSTYMEDYLMDNHREDYNNLRAAMDNVDGNFYEEMDKYYEKYKKKAKEFEKKAAEDARYVLPNATETKIVVTMNARTLLHFFEVRCCNRAQWEIRAMADEMLRLVREVYPTIFKKAGASCEFGKCKEGKMSCGNPRVR
jgi:thymidylate synthase (FAD)